MKLLKPLHLRLINQIGFWICLVAIGFALYLQFNNALTPCPLCIAQRLVIGLLALAFLYGWLHLFRGTGRKIHGASITLLSLLGSALAGRQVWLEHLPPASVPPCGPSFSYIVEHLPFQETLKALFQGTAECAEVTWRMLGLTIPSWTLIIFIIFLGFGIWEILREDEK